MRIMTNYTYREDLHIKNIVIIIEENAKVTENPIYDSEGES